MIAWGEEMELSFLHELCAELEVNFQLLKMMTILDTKNWLSQNSDKFLQKRSFSRTQMKENIIFWQFYKKNSVLWFQ